MAALATSLLVASVAASALGAVTQMSQANKAEKAAKNQMQQQDAAQKKLEAEAANRQSVEDANALRDSQRATQRARGAASGGRSSTILTGPLGVAGDSQTGTRKTLLGE